MRTIRLSPAMSIALLIAIGAFVATFVPALLVYRAASGNWQGVPPELITDSLYYYAQIHEVSDGHPRVGNPFFVEHRNEIAPAFFLPVDIAAIPMFFGASITMTALIDLFFWTSIFLLLCYLILRASGLSRTFAYTGGIIAFLGSYMFMVRPVAMQIIFPAFLFFLLSYIWFLKSPTKKTALLLAIGILLAPYTYTYFAYIVIGTMIGTAILFLVYRKWNELKLLFLSGSISVVATVPFVFGIFIPEIHHPLYGETIKRIGLVLTHIPANEFLYYGRWVVLVLCTILLLARGTVATRIRTIGSDPVSLFLFASGLGLLFAAGNNILTGVELSLAIHIGRFIILWLSLALCILIFRYRGISKIEMRKPLPILALLLIIFAAFSLVRNIPRSFAFATKDNLSPTETVQKYAPAFQVIREHTLPGSVVWSNDTIARYIPIMTSGYVLYTEAGGLQIVSDNEMIDRYLVSRFGTSSDRSLRSDIGKYLGAGVGKEQPIAINRSIAWCERIQKILNKKECGDPTNGQDILGDEFFNALLLRATKIQTDRVPTLETFHVSYLLLDQETDPTIQILDVSGDVVWSDERFALYRLK